MTEIVEKKATKRTYKKKPKAQRLVLPPKRGKTVSRDKDIEQEDFNEKITKKT